MAIVNQRELAEILGKTQQTLWDWQKTGMPVLRHGENGTENQYDTAAVIAWWIQREMQKNGNESAKDRLARLQADKVELELQEMRGQLLPADLVAPAWTSRVVSARAYLLAERDRLAHLLEATPGFDAKRDLLAQTFDEFLRKLAGDAGSDGPDPGAPEEGVGEAGAAGAHDAGAVGGEVPVPVG